MPGGRPSSYKPEYCEMLIEFLAQGYFYKSFAGKVGVCFDTLYEWEKVHPEFSEAKKRGVAMAHLKWDEFGNDTLHSGNKCDTAMYIHRMGNQFGWRRSDPVKVEQETTKEGSRLVIDMGGSDD